MRIVPSYVPVSEPARMFSCCTRTVPVATARLVEVGLDGVHIISRRVTGESDHRVVVKDGAVLAVDDVPDGIMQAKAHEEQGRAARDANDRHEEAPLVAEEVAAGNLP